MSDMPRIPSVPSYISLMYKKGRPRVAATHPVITWTKASACGNGACVEVAVQDNRVLVRDSKVEDGPHLNFSRASWQAFTNALRSDALGSD
jgi:hypothetical protein